jgi:hypothetical protein
MNLQSINNLFNQHNEFVEYYLFLLVAGSVTTNVIFLCKLKEFVEYQLCLIAVFGKYIRINTLCCFKN